MTNSPQTPDAPSRAWVSLAVKTALTAVVVYFAAKQLLSHWEEVATYHWEINPLLMAISVLAHLMTFVVLTVVWRILMRGFGFEVPFPAAFKISYIAGLARYIPGRIWPMFGMVYYAKQARLDPKATVASWGVALLYGFPTSFLVALLSVAIHPEFLQSAETSVYSTGVWLLTGLTVVMSIVLIFAPQASLVLLNWALRLVRRPEVSLRLDKTVALKVYFGYFFGWICYGISFWLFLKSIDTHAALPATAGVGSFVLAYQIGYLTLFSPGGLGTRELALTAMLTPFLGGIAAGVAVASRLWSLCVEIVAAGIAALIKLDKRSD
jgi:uncharacterized membrane protein YbhN (UPF0104 family)